MNTDQLKVWLARAWQGKVAEMYKEGYLTDEEMLKAAFFHALHNSQMPEIKIWLSQKLNFPPFKESDFLNWEIYHKKKKLQGFKADMLVTYKDELLAMMVLNFVPGGYGDFREHLDILETIHGLRGEGKVRLKINPHSGNPMVDHGYSISEDLLVVYTVLNNEASMSLELSKLKEHCTDPLFWYYFYFLKAGIGANKIKFRVAEGNK
ncbi:MAG: hypothetical protein MRZ79_14085 [Bacteroidia bacterium]|nr:hypothetical protein [Bacteroidia bacterium]